MDNFERGQFTFYRSFYDAAKNLSDREKLRWFLALCEYGLFAIEPDFDPDADFHLFAMFALVRPNLDAARRKAVLGKIGGDVGAGGAPAGNQNARKHFHFTENNSKKEIEKENKEIDIEREGIARGEEPEQTSPADRGSSPQNGATRGEKMTDADFERLRQERINQLLNFERSQKK